MNYRQERKKGRAVINDSAAFSLFDIARGRRALSQVAVFLFRHSLAELFQDGRLIAALRRIGALGATQQPRLKWL